MIRQPFPSVLDLRLDPPTIVLPLVLSLEWHNQFRFHFAEEHFKEVLKMLDILEMAFETFKESSNFNQLLHAFLVIFRSDCRIALGTQITSAKAQLEKEVRLKRVSLPEEKSESYARSELQGEYKKGVEEKLALNPNDFPGLVGLLHLMVLNQLSWLGNSIAAQILGPLESLGVLQDSPDLIDDIQQDVELRKIECAKAKVFLDWLRNFFPKEEYKQV